MNGIEALLLALLWVIGVPVVVFGIAAAVGYDWKKPWLMWRTPAGPLPLWAYLVVSACLAIALLLAAAAR